MWRNVKDNISKLLFTSHGTRACMQIFVQCEHGNNLTEISQCI